MAKVKITYPCVLKQYGTMKIFTATKIARIYGLECDKVYRITIESIDDDDNSDVPDYTL